MNFKIFIHINSSLEYKVAEVVENQKVGHLIKDFTPQLSNQKDFMEDVEIYIENSNDDLDKGITISEAGIKHGDHIFIGRCKKVPVTISYAGRQFPVSVSPSTNMLKLKRKALEHFGIDKVSGADLLLWFKQKPLDQRQLIGSLTDYPACNVELVLAAKNDVNGDPSRDLFLHHTNQSNYLSGEIEERWGLLTPIDEVTWPICYIWVKDKEETKFTFKFDLTSYPRQAPTSVMWDAEKNTILPLNLRPQHNKRCIQIFKDWGKQCNYLPCDRLAIQGHHGWNTTHSSLIWNPNEDTIYKYLNELYETLNA